MIMSEKLPKSISFNDSVFFWKGKLLNHRFCEITVAWVKYVTRRGKSAKPQVLQLFNTNGIKYRLTLDYGKYEYVEIQGDLNSLKWK